MESGKLLNATVLVLLLFLVDADVILTEREALMRLKKSLDDPLLALNSWNTSGGHCQWHGIACSVQGRVVGVHLNSLSLSGPAPFPTIQALTSLRNFSISGNNITGSVSEIDSSKNCSLESLDMSLNKLEGIFPGNFMTTCKNIKFMNLSGNELSGISTIGKSSMVSLDLSRNNISGTLPASLFTSCKGLEFLDFSMNLITGAVPKSIVTNCNGLKHLSLACNNFTGTFPALTSSKRNLTKLNISTNFLTEFHIKQQAGCMSLEELDVSFNNLSGTIFWTECATVKVLNLSNNAFSGPILTVIANQSLNNVLGSLEILDAKHNELTGEVPLVPPSLRVLDLSSNMLNSISKNICSQNSSLKSLVLVYNRLTGAALNSVMHCKHLEMLDLSINFINESIPGDLCNELAKLRYLVMWGNQFEGNIPVNLGKCKELLALDLSHNHFYGIIPEQLAELVNITFLLLNNNRLSGTIPASLGRLQNLLSLSLGHNYLQGGIPTELRNCSSLLKFEANDNMLTGPIPTWLGRSEPVEGYANPIPFLNMMVSSEDPFSCKGYQTTYLLQGISLEQLQQLPFIKWCDNLFAEAPPGYSFHKLISSPLVIDVSYNNLTGTIPAEFGRMNNSLYVFMLAGNSLTGEIPAGLGNLKNLAWLDLSSNQLYSRIPESFSKLTFLQYFNLSHNKLFGAIPSGQVQTFSPSSFEGNLQLCGIPLESCITPLAAPGGENKQLDQSSNKFEVLVGVIAGLISSFLWSITVFCWSDMGRQIEKLSDR